METSGFVNWFKIFLEMVKEPPLLLLYDRHLIHISIPMIKAALEQDVILKFPPLVTDVLQPLEKRINKFGMKHCLTILEFEIFFLFPAMQKEGRKKENVISGFEKTKIFIP